MATRQTPRCRVPRRSRLSSIRGRGALPHRTRPCRTLATPTTAPTGAHHNPFEEIANGSPVALNIAQWSARALFASARPFEQSAQTRPVLIANFMYEYASTVRDAASISGR